MIKDNKQLRLIAHQIRLLSIDAIEKAGCGHPGLPLGMADIATVLWANFLKFNPKNTNWFDRDRFLLSAGHGSMLLYGLLHLFGFPISITDLKQFRQWKSKTPGHPEYGHVPGVEITTGPLGQGLASAVGFALAEKLLAHEYNIQELPSLIDHHTYVIASDGDLMEGISHEACSLAGHWKLNKLIVLYDDNQITIDGNSELAVSDQVAERFQAYGWAVVTIENGHNLEQIKTALQKTTTITDKPKLVICKTKIGYGSPNRQSTAKAHGEALGREETLLTKKFLLSELNLDIEKNLQPFSYIFDIVELQKNYQTLGKKNEKHWDNICHKYQTTALDKFQEFSQRICGKLPKNWQTNIDYTNIDQKAATRKMSGQILSQIFTTIPGLIGGSADLTPSVNTFHQGMQPYQSDLPTQGTRINYLHYGVREHAMSAIMNGMALHKGFIPYGGTFLVFSDYMRPGIRLAALMGLQIIYILTHDSIALGEDGPTHQPIEHLTSLRVIPNLQLLRPSSAQECIDSWTMALKKNDGPTCIVLSRQAFSTHQYNSKPSSPFLQSNHLGLYIAYDSRTSKEISPQIILLATGSEVALASQVAQLLHTKHSLQTRVISILDFTRWQNLNTQEYQHLLNITKHQSPPIIAAIEAGTPQLWLSYVSRTDLVFGINCYGASAPYPRIYEEYGFSSQKIVDKILQTLPT